MENFNNEIFGFGSDTNEELEQTNNFNYDSISGLGQSDYENEDLFAVNTDTENYDYNIDTNYNSFDDENSNFGVPFAQEYKLEEENSLDENQNEVDDFEEVFIQPLPEVEEKSVEEDTQTIPAIGPGLPVYEEQSEDVVDIPTEVIEENNDINEEPVEEVVLSETPIEQLQKLTEYEEEKIEKTDINALFDKVSGNFKDASDIFRKNSDLKAKIDTRFEELKKLQSEIENSRKTQIDEINKYKEEVVAKLTEKKEEIEKRLNLLKESQATLEKEKQEFEQYRKKEQENIDKVQKEVQSAYDDRREELGHIEDVLRKQKDALDEERSQLSLDRIQYESDKNELANNLLKFNELVNSFTNGMNNIKE